MRTPFVLNVQRSKGLAAGLPAVGSATPPRSPTGAGVRVLARTEKGAGTRFITTLYGAQDRRGTLRGGMTRMLDGSPR